MCVRKMRGCKQNIECGKKQLTHEGEPAADERAGARLARRTVGVKVKECLCEKGAEGKQNCKVENNDLRYETRHALVRLDVGCRV